MSENMDERLLDLLSDQATTGPGDDASANSSMDAQSLELAAAAIMLAETDLNQEMPSHLEARILADADKHFAALKDQEGVSESIHDQATQTFKWSESRPKRSFFDWFGWATAAAACVVLAVSVFVMQSQISDLRAQLDKAKPTPTPELPSLLQQRERLLASAGDITRAEWKQGNVKETENIVGDVVWSDAKQVGYLTLKGLPINDANKEQYQLWIFDETQSEKTPIDGGVFNVTGDGEVIIPIDAKLKARNPKAFAITIEQPGGVVVTTRDRLAGLAPVKPSQT